MQGSSMPSRVFMDGPKRLAASVIRRAIVDAIEGDVAAENWLRGPMAPWFDILGADPSKLHKRLDVLLAAESIQQFLSMVPAEVSDAVEEHGRRSALWAEDPSSEGTERFLS